MTYRVNNMAEFESLKKRETKRTLPETGDHHPVAPKKPAGTNKYKQQIDLIFMALEVPRRTGGIPIEVTKEFYFAKPRKWRFDWALEAIKVAVEYEGLPLQVEKSRHTTIAGFCGDCEKYSVAAILGWCVVRVNAISVDSGLAHELIKRAVDSRRITHTSIPGATRLGITHNDL